MTPLSETPAPAALTGNRRIHLLPPEEARKIAAGEVVDRPAALVREFLDNAIDAGSSLIEVIIEGGGIRRIEVIDDGLGMGEEDLRICWQTHATSKIRSVEDLNTAETLGFRGEALAAAAVVSRLEITTSTDGREAWVLTVGPGGAGAARIEQTHRARGTSVRARGIFDSIPARKRFLKREGTEGGICRQVFIDKALAFPAIHFRFVQEGQLKLILPAASSYKERFAQTLLARPERSFLYEISAQGQGFSVAILAGGPELSRRDRRLQYVFANGRRISDFSLLQALEYGLQGWFPNGQHPVGAVFVDIDPALADVNIHPAKREIRFKDPGAIHHSITTALQDFVRRRNSAAGRVPREFPGEFSGGLPRGFPGELPGPSRQEDFFSRGYAPGKGEAALALEALLERPPAFAPRPSIAGEDFADKSVATPMGEHAGDPFDEPFGESTGEPAGEPVPAYAAGPFSGAAAADSLRFVGRLFSLFVLIERGDRFFIIDQHAAHERILFDRFIADGITRQELLVPIPFSTESEGEDRFLRENQEALAQLGVLIAGEDGVWRIEALPADWRMGDAETIREILNLRAAREDMTRRWAATLCCHNAIKDGDYLDENAALALAKAAFALPVPLCPHGRPVWWEISREQLFHVFKRT